MNKVILIGRLTKDPEVRTTTTGKAVTTITLAVDRRYKQDGQPSADFIPCVAWGKVAEVIANNLSKGRRLGVYGRIQIRSYDGNDGNKHYVTEVIVDEITFLDSKKGNNSVGFEGQAIDDESIPF